MSPPWLFRRGRLHKILLLILSLVCDWSYWIKFITRFNKKLLTQIENVSLSGVPEVIFRQSYELFTAELNKGSCYVVLLARWASKENFGNALKSGWYNPANLLIASSFFLFHGHNWNTLPLLLSNRVCEKERRSTFGITAILMHRFPKAWGNTQTTIKISETSLFWVLLHRSYEGIRIQSSSAPKWPRKKAHTQSIERQNLTLRTRLKR